MKPLVRRPEPHRLRRELAPGFSLVELLVAMALTVVVGLFGATLLLEQKRIGDTEEAFLIAQDTARNLLSTMERDILMAGFGTSFGATRLDAIIANEPSILDAFSPNAITLISNCTPCRVPFAIASMDEWISCPVSSSPEVSGCVSGTMILAMVIAAGALMTEAVRMCPRALGMTPPRMLAYNTIIVPAMVAMPQVITTNSSLRVMRSR